VDDDLAARLAEWTADARAADAAAERARQRWLEQQAAEDVSLEGVVRALAERRADVAITLRNGSTRHGRLTAVGADFAVLSTDKADGPTTLLPFAAIAVLRAGAGPAVMGGPADDDAAPGLTLAAALARLVGDRPPVRIDGNAGPVVGELVAAAGGVVVVRLDAEVPGGRPTAYVPIGAVVSLTLV